jgi:hypothetical protein
MKRFAQGLSNFDFPLRGWELKIQFLSHAKQNNSQLPKVGLIMFKNIISSYSKNRKKSINKFFDKNSEVLQCQGM